MSLSCPICDAWNEEYETYCVECDSNLDVDTVDWDIDEDYRYFDEEDH